MRKPVIKMTKRTMKAMLTGAFHPRDSPVIK